MNQLIKKINYSLVALSLTTAANLAQADLISAPSGWYIGAAVSALWLDAADTITVANGSAYPPPYNVDAYTVHKNTDSAASLTAGYKWLRASQWLPGYSLGLRYQRFFMPSINGTITQYSLPQFTNYAYSWDLSADLLSLYSKIDLVEYGRFRPFFDLGIGWAMNRGKNFYETAYAGVTPRISPDFSRHTQNNVAFNVGLGVDYALNTHCVLSLAYDYQYLGTMRSGNGATTWGQEQLDLGSYKGNMLTLGVSYHFDNNSMITK